MAASLRTGLCLSVPYGVGSEKRGSALSPDVLAWKNKLKGGQVVLPSTHAQTSICNQRALRWWEKSIKGNMIEIRSAQELVDSLLNSGDKLVVVGFYSPGCGGCKALHPKICQIADSNPSALFLKVNYDELKPVCRSLNIHVLPFFQFFRGAQGRVCSFSCTNATIFKFKDALTKHGIERCSLGPAKGLEESELMSLASEMEPYFSYPLGSSRSGALSPLGL